MKTPEKLTCVPAFGRQNRIQTHTRTTAAGARRPAAAVRVLKQREEKQMKHRSRKTLCALLAVVLLIALLPMGQGARAYEGVSASEINSKSAGTYSFYTITSTAAGKTLTLTADLNLYLDEDLKLTSINGSNYNLIITGHHHLTVNNPSGIAIHIHSMTIGEITADISAAGYAILSSENLAFTEGCKVHVQTSGDVALMVTAYLSFYKEGTEVTIDAKKYAAMAHSIIVGNPLVIAEPADGLALEQSSGDRIMMFYHPYGENGLVKANHVLISTPKIYTITFNPMGGTVTPVTADTKADGRLASFPTPTREGYKFAGWYSAPAGGSMVPANTAFTRNTTLYARWTKLETPPSNPFTDVPESEYYFEPVLWAVNHTPQITKGTSDTTFSPNATCTRGQVVTFLWRAMGEPEPTSTANKFSDVQTTDYFYKAVLWAVEKGITLGTSYTTFSPNNPCTRAHVVTFLWRAEGQPSASGANPFADVASGQYYYSAVLWAVSKNITQGTSASTFSPDNPCTRAQIVTFLYRDMK